MIEFFHRAAGTPARLAVLSSAFNPPTLAHLALAQTALTLTDQVLFVLPRAFPHKQYTGPGFAERLEMLEAAVAGEPRCSIGASDGGLFIEIAQECHAAYGPATRLYFLCGRDAAERIVNWDYGAPGAFLAQLEHFDLLVAARGGRYDPPPEIAAHVHTLALPSEYDDVSSSEVRRRIAAGEPWEHLVPPAVVPLARRRYNLRLER